MFKNIKLFQPFNFFIWMTFYTPLASIYFARVTGSYALALSVFSISQLTRAVLEVPSGIFSDTYGRRKCLIIGAWLSFLAVTTYALAGNYWVLVLGAVFSGASNACFSGNNDALLFESLPKKKRQLQYQESVGRICSTMEFSFLVGGVVGGIIVNWSWPLIMWLSLVPQLVGLTLSYRFKEPATHVIKDREVYSHLREAFGLLKDNAMLKYLAVTMVMSMAIGEAIWPLVAVFYNSVIPVWLVGFMVSANYLISAISYRSSGWVLSQIKPFTLLIVDRIYSPILFSLGIIFPSVFSPVSMALSSIFYGPGEVAKNSLLQQELTDKQRATLSSMISLLGSLSYGLGGIFFGTLADKIGVGKSLLLSQILLLPVLWLYLKMKKIRKSF
jgi:MFS family permease